MNNAHTEQSATTHKPVHPALFTVLILPMGVSFGYISVTLGYLLSQAGVPVDKVAALVAASLFPHVLKFLWAPLVDTTMSFKKWYLISGIVSSAGIVAMSVLPMREASLPLLTLIVYLYHFSITFLCMATEGLMAYDVPDAAKGRAGGFFQAGNLGGMGVGGGLALALAQRLSSPAMVGTIMAGLCLLCCLALFFFKDRKSTIRASHMGATYRNLAADVWDTIKTRSGWLALTLCFMTLGTGAASNLWSSVANDWKASADTVALVTGVMGGLVSAVGCLAGGWICDRMNARYAYLLFGLLSGVCAVCMGYAPRTQAMFVAFTSLYALINGLVYAGFTAFALEAIGKGAAATKYNIFAALSNSPTYLMTYVVGVAYTRHGASGMLNTEAAFAVGAALVFLLLQQVAYGSDKDAMRRKARTG